MIKKLLIVGFGVVAVSALSGCDVESIAKVAPDAAKMLAASHGPQNGDLLMDRLRSQDRLRDGTGENCPHPGDPGDCDGTGPYGPGGPGGNGGGNGSGNGGGG